MNAASEKDSEQLREARFKFGKIQAYVALGVAVIGALILLITVLVAVINGFATFPVIFALALFYAITQGGTHGFSRLIDAISELVKKFRSDSKVENNDDKD